MSASERLEQPRQAGPIRQVVGDERHVIPIDVARARRIADERHDIVTAVGETGHDGTADEPGTARDHDAHVVGPRSTIRRSPRRTGRSRRESAPMTASSVGHSDLANVAVRCVELRHIIRWPMTTGHGSYGHTSKLGDTNVACLSPQRPTRSRRA